MTCSSSNSSLVSKQSKRDIVKAVQVVLSVVLYILCRSFWEVGRSWCSLLFFRYLEFSLLSVTCQLYTMVLQILLALFALLLFVPWLIFPILLAAPWPLQTIYLFFYLFWFCLVMFSFGFSTFGMHLLFWSLLHRQTDLFCHALAFFHFVCFSCSPNRFKYLSNTPRGSSSGYL